MVCERGRGQGQAPAPEPGQVPEQVLGQGTAHWQRAWHHHASSMPAASLHDLVRRHGHGRLHSTSQPGKGGGEPGQQGQAAQGLRGECKHGVCGGWCVGAAPDAGWIDGGCTRTHRGVASHNTHNTLQAEKAPYASEVQGFYGAGTRKRSIFVCRSHHFCPRPPWRLSHACPFVGELSPLGLCSTVKGDCAAFFMTSKVSCTSSDTNCASRCIALSTKSS